VRHIFQPVLNSLSRLLNGDTSMASITSMAEQIAVARGIRIDRMARRLKDATVCWLCENAPELALGYVPIHVRQSRPSVSVERSVPPQPAPAPAPPLSPLEAPVPPLFGDFFRLSDREWNAEDDDAFWEIRS
jgi:hypothetical protein